MLTIQEAEEILKKEYHIDNFTYILGNVLLPDYKWDKHPIEFNNDIFTSVTQLGESDKCNISVFEVYVKDNCQNRRVAITQGMFRILRGLRTDNALVAFVNADKKNYRISLLTSKYEYDGEKIVKVVSNPRRYSYSLGYGTKTKTAYQFLISKGKVNNLDELITRFSVEVVNKQFYAEIATRFTELVGGERGGNHYDALLKLHGTVSENKYKEFGVRLIGRIMFCWFLREKRSEQGVPLVPDEYLSIEKIKSSVSYYNQVLEPLFFELLNTNHNKRKEEFRTVEFNLIPYLNGGLFSPHSDDMYYYDRNNRSGRIGVVTIPNDWFIRLYEVLGEYNFTVDENTAYDIELSIDPEMLGRIFENLLAEINPETGENAKISTGSFYTPRDIVDYMVDSSLCEYLKQKTSLPEEKLKALISYSKEDDELAVFTYSEKKKLIDALYNVTVLDPACGSGAFPIGMLQKIVYILQEIDPNAELWFDKATENVDYLLKKEFEKEFIAGKLNYIRKLSVIQKSIFGIDIQPIAVEISRLRCFLSLIIEEKVDDKKENRDIKPLPNLDFKFIIANSLIGLDSSLVGSNNTEQTSMFEDQDHIKKLKNIREEYFSANSERRTELKLAFMNIQQDMLVNTIANYNKKASLKYQQLSEWKPFENQATSWFDPEWMFGIKDGFDIVIGNPPYIDYRKIDDYTKKHLNQFASYKLSKMASIFVYFIELGSKLLKSNGLLVYINPYQYFSSKAGFGIRNYICNKFPLVKVVDLSDIKVFEEAAAYTCINIFIKTKLPQNIEYYKPYNLDRIEFNKGKISYTDICKNNKKEIIINRNPIIYKMDQLSNSVSTFAKICVGSSYGGFRNYVSTLQKPGYMPLVESSDIQKYYFKSQGYVDKSIYPDELRKKFETQKALYMARMTKDIRVALGVPGYYLGKVNYITCGNENILLGLLIILNSKLISYYYRIKNESKHLSGGYLGMDTPSVKAIPLPSSFSSTNWVDYYARMQISDDIDFDNIIYKLYGLSYDEIELVENKDKH